MDQMRVPKKKNKMGAPDVVSWLKLIDMALGTCFMAPDLLNAFFSLPDKGNQEQFTFI